MRFNIPGCNFNIYFSLTEDMHENHPQVTDKVPLYHLQLTLALQTPHYYRHPDNMDSSLEIPGKINYRHLTEINSRYYGLWLSRTLTHGPNGICNKGS